jgi:cation diffusion facilitator CzcD-associated flavoprotein CzcO
MFAAHHAISLERDVAATVHDVRVIIIGTGFGGIGTAVRLLEDGVTDITLLERAEDTGGTWRDNSYPGAACDIPSHLYSLSFEPKSDWSRQYAPQPEIRAYLDEIVERHDLRTRTTFGFDVRECRWDDAEAAWTLTSQSGEQVVGDVLINAIGGLKDAARPNVPGLESFTGPMFHSAEWNHDVDLFGKRIGVIGTGASAIQFIPELAEVASELTVFQRTPPWIVPRGDRAYRWYEHAILEHVPGARLAHRAALWLEHEAGFVAFAGDGPAQKIAERYAARHLRSQVHDPELRKKLMPSYQFGCKRVLRSDDYYPALTRPNVKLETGSIACVTPTGVTLADGTELVLDAIVLGTGFKVSDPLNGMVVRGTGGVDLDDFWDERPSAHLGITVPGFPNHFMLLGPNSALGHNSVVLQIESQIQYVRQAVAQLRTNDVVSIDVTTEAHDKFVRTVDGKNKGNAWSSGCSSWYLNDRGENFSVWPGTTAAYRFATRRFDPAKHHVRSRTELPTPTEAVT